MDLENLRNSLLFLTSRRQGLWEVHVWSIWGPAGVHLWLFPPHICATFSHCSKGRQNPGGAITIPKSDWKVEAMSPGVADHSTLGIPQYATGWWLRTWWIILPERAKFLKATGRLRQCPRELRITAHSEYPNTPVDGGCVRQALHNRLGQKRNSGFRYMRKTLENVGN